MANEPSGKDFIEGWVKDGKSVEQIQSLQKLQEAAGVIKSEDARTKQELQKAEKALEDLQAKLSQTNDELVKCNMELETKHKAQQFTLDSDHQKKLKGMTFDAVKEFLGDRPESEEDERAVDVHFFPGEEGRTGSVFFGGEGAGSHDAKFKVQIRQTVKDLSDQAARYWGLNRQQVFFLDRDGRIVPDDMKLSDIILPPLPPTSHVDGGAGVGALDTIQETALALNDGANGTSRPSAVKSCIVKGRDYGLTLVRASTVLDKEDLEKPKGEQPVDFTFDAVALNQDLENTRKKRGDDLVQIQRANLDEIPSLHALVQRGREVKRKRHIDTAKRGLEVTIFVVCYLLFWLVLNPRDIDIMRQWGAMQTIVSKFTTFQNEDLSRPALSNFLNVTSIQDYAFWVWGPYLRTLQDGSLNAYGLFPVGVTIRRYRVDNFNSIEGFDYCGDGDDDANTTMAAIVEAVNTTSTSTSTSTSSGSTSSTSTSTSTNPLGEEVTFTTARPTTTRTGQGCVDTALRWCPNSRVVQIYEAMLDLGYAVPPCTPVYEKVVQDQFIRAGDEPFSWVRGIIHTYSGGDKVILNLSSNLTEIDFFSMAESDTSDTALPALSFITFVYNPSLNAMHIVRFLLEVSPTLSVIPSIHLQTVKVSGLAWWDAVLYVVIIICSITCFCMETARAMRNPFNTGERKEGCTKWTFLFLFMPILIVTSFILIEYRTTDADVGPVEKMLSSQVEEVESASDTLFRYSLLDYYSGILNLVIILLFNVLLVRYALVFFPQLKYVTAMVETVIPTLAVLICIMILTFLMLSLWPYGFYSASFFQERNLVLAIVSSIKIASGRQEDWYRLYESSPILYTLLSVAAFTMFTLILDNMPIAVMVSHLKEKSLRENYSYHYWWGQAKTEKKMSEEKLNPAKLGFDFSGKKPKEIKY